MSEGGMQKSGVRSLGGRLSAVRHSPFPLSTSRLGGSIPVFGLLLVSLTCAAFAGTFPIDSAVNLSQFKLSTGERDRLGRNGFVVVPDSREQLFQLYVDNWWGSTPSFVTTDLMLQLFHLSVNSTLRRIEEERLFYDLVEFSRGMATRFNNPGQPRLAAYFGVGCRLLGAEVRLDPTLDSLCKAELERIEDHAGRAESAIFPFTLDYSLFQPRGHYMRNDTLKAYFRAMMWYGTVPFPLEDPNLKPEEVRALTRDAVRMSLAIAQSDSLERFWQEILEITSFFSGPSEAYTPQEYLSALVRLQPEAAGTDCRNWTAPETGFTSALAKELTRVRWQKIHQVADGIPTGPQFRLFGRRYVPDTDIMQRLVNWPDRPFPKGLDVFAALGSERAEHILTDVYREQDRWPSYPESLAQVKAEFARQDTAFWFKNIYYAWLYALQALNQPVPKRAPQFMQNPAWQDKSLNSSLGSWAELRHDAILYAEGTLAESDVPDMTKGYVEPNPEFYGRLLGAVETMEKLLAGRKLETGRIREDCRWFKQTLVSLKTISQKELDGMRLTDDELSLIWNIGNDVEGISCRLVDESIERWYQVQGAERFMACIADVATSQDTCLEVGVAAGNTIHALVPIDGKWTLTRGAVFSYREFLWPVSDRLTDEKWQQMVRDGKAPYAPVWTKNFTAGE
jgi:hypothetical protein